MGFISFNEKYYARKLVELENKVLTNEQLYEAKQLLKVLDDLIDEGYTDLDYALEHGFSCVTRLRKIISDNNDIPFPIEKNSVIETSYSKEEFKLESIVDSMISEAKKEKQTSYNPFLADVIDYCNWIGYQEDTAYVFLFRDALLPYVYYKSRNRNNLYAWLISRKSIYDLTQTKDVDDDIRLPIFVGLESGITDFERLCLYCKDEMLKVLDQHTTLKKALTDLLASIKEKHIMVIESGYCGTIPMLLKAMDERVTFSMYTTAPYLYETYKNNIFCKRYEDIREFETLNSQDMFLEYSSFKDNGFYVKKATNEEIKEKSLLEVNRFLPQDIQRK